MNTEDRRLSFLRLAPIVYGRYWKTDVSTHLEISKRSIFDWIKGVSRVPRSVVFLLQMYALCNFRYQRDTNSMKREKTNVKRIAANREP